VRLIVLFTELSLAPVIVTEEVLEMTLAVMALLVLPPSLVKLREVAVPSVEVTDMVRDVALSMDAT
jgi:hypothetical protein